MARIITSTGKKTTGWKDHLRSNYNNDQFCWTAYAEMYRLHLRLGFATPDEAWNVNPMIQGSINSADFAVYYKKI